MAASSGGVRRLSRELAVRRRRNSQARPTALLGGVLSPAARRNRLADEF